MAVETYLEEELKELVVDAEKNDEWQEKVKELGLQGQQGMTVEEKSPIPFPRMTREMNNVYKTLCPTPEPVERYSGSTIPLRVVSMIALCRQEQYFAEIKVWHNLTAPDPVLVGYQTKSWDSPMFIIARWGDELRSFVELKQLALKDLLAEKTAEYEGRLSSVKTDVTNFINGKTHSP